VKKVFFYFSCLVFSISSFAKVQQAVTEQQVNRYFELAGVNQLLKSVPEQINAMYLDTVNEQGAHATDSKILAALVNAWQQQEITSHVIQSVSQRLEQAQLQALMTWQTGSLALKMKSQDALPEQEDFAQGFEQFAMAIPQSLPSIEKRQLINQLIDSKQMVESMVELTISVSEPVMIALMASPTAAQDGFDQEVINAQLRELRGLLEDDLSQQMAMLSYYLYRDLTETELAAYVEFYQSDVGQLELDILSSALHQSIALWQANYYTQKASYLPPLAALN